MEDLLSFAYREKCFTFTWKLENASYCLQKKGEHIASPIFTVDEIQETKWRLWLYPRGEQKDGNHIGFYLRREWDNNMAANVEVKYELAFVEKGDSVFKSYCLIKRTFSMNEGYGYPQFAKLEDVFILQRSTFLPEGALTVRCRIWKSIGDMTESVRCFARTLIGIEKRSFDWKIENFRSYSPETASTYVIKSLKNATKLMSVNLTLTGGMNCEEVIHFKLTCHDNSFRYCAFRLSLRGRECNQDEYWIDKLVDSHQFTLPFSKQKLTGNYKYFYLLDDNLPLFWECAFSKGIVYEEIEEVQLGREHQLSESPFFKTEK